MPIESPADGNDDRGGSIPQLHPLRREFGLDVPPWSDENLAPPVNQDALRALWQKALSAAESRALWTNVLRFRSWAESLCRVMAEDFLPPKDDHD